MPYRTIQDINCKNILNGIEPHLKDDTRIDISKLVDISDKTQLEDLWNAGNAPWKIW